MVVVVPRQGRERARDKSRKRPAGPSENQASMVGEVKELIQDTRDREDKDRDINSI